MRTRSAIRTLLIGCGRIGAGVGAKSQRLDSHAGVLSRLDDFDVFLYDPVVELAGCAATALGFSVLPKFSHEFLAECQCAVICSPTSSHYEYLVKFLTLEIPLIICEKPVCDSLEDVSRLENLRKESGSRVLVNYTRRFQPNYIILQAEVRQTLRCETLRACAVRYQRGFLNNASHGLDLLQFLLGWDIAQADVRVSHADNDEFSDDPTLTCVGTWNGAVVTIMGLPQVRFSLFEIDLFFERSAIRLRDRGDTIEFMDSAAPSEYYSPLITAKLTSGSLQSPLESLYHCVRGMLLDSAIQDNFEESLRLTKWMLGATKQKAGLQG
jgi:predicted dehydrogenase